MEEPNYYETRLRRLRERMAARKLAALLVAKPVNVFYLTGFRGSAGMAIVDSSGVRLLVDPRYTLQAREQTRTVNVEVVEARDGLLRAAAKALNGRRGRRAVGFEESFLTVGEFSALKREAGASVEWRPSRGMIEDLRVTKDEVEIEHLREACRLTSQVFQEVTREIRPGVSELELAAELDFRMRRKGAEGAAFDSIVASGRRGALPHASPSSKPLGANELVIFDLGAILGGYRADLSRTVYLGTPGRRVRALYQAVWEAQEAAIDRLRAGVRAEEVDAEARRRLATRRLGRLFTHSTGHGVGLEIHERPRVAKGEKTVIPARAVVTVEPGIYLEAFGGIRIEDTVLVGEAGTEILTSAPKDAWWTG